LPILRSLCRGTLQHSWLPSLLDPSVFIVGQLRKVKFAAQSLQVGFQLPHHSGHEHSGAGAMGFTMVVQRDQRLAQLTNDAAAQVIDDTGDFGLQLG